MRRREESWSQIGGRLIDASAKKLADDFSVPSTNNSHRSLKLLLKHPVRRAWCRAWSNETGYFDRRRFGFQYGLERRVTAPVLVGSRWRYRRLAWPLRQFLIQFKGLTMAHLVSIQHWIEGGDHQAANGRRGKVFNHYWPGRA
ncbi:MAG: hypothetical protein IPL72_08065 [Sulfuritalea sp.]|nr:hypothetical protein [Sulfuritalea sp.]